MVLWDWVREKKEITAIFCYGVRDGTGQTGSGEVQGEVWIQCESVTQAGVTLQVQTFYRRSINRSILILLKKKMFLQEVMGY